MVYLLGWLSAFVECILMPLSASRKSVPGIVFGTRESLATPLPFFHAMGVGVLVRSILFKARLVLLPHDRPPSAQLITQVLEQAGPSSAVLPPALLEQMVATTEGLEALSKLDLVVFGGAPLAGAVGDKIIEKTSLVSLLGATETGFMPTLVPSSATDWAYFEWAPGGGLIFDPQGDDLHELVIKRNKDRRYQGIFHSFPQHQEWRTKDLYEQHPSKPHLWKYKGRKDDVIVLSIGEKVQPTDGEKTIEGHPSVKGALVVGEGRFQCSLLVEPDWEVLPLTISADDFLETIWPTIEKANAGLPAHGRIWKSNKPFVRSAKGSVMRRQTNDLYKAEIEALYSNEAHGKLLGTLDESADLPTIRTFLRNAMRLAGLRFPDNAKDTEDIFSYGVDSLQVLAVSSTLSHACGESRQTAVSPRAIYAHPTIASLASSLHGSGKENGVTRLVDDRADVMSAMLEKYTSDLPPAKTSSRAQTVSEEHTVILTGSMGSLGNYILQELVASGQVKRVYCLSRSCDAQDRQCLSFDARCAPIDFTKVRFLQSDFGKERFGLSERMYTKLLQSVDLLIHNAWAVDFNKSLESFESVHVAGVRRCVDFSTRSQYRAHIVFISSIASVANWSEKHSNELEVPEMMLEDHSLPSRSGYGESKHIAGLILGKAAGKSGVSSTVIRAGQLAGPSDGSSVWNKHEWLPSLVITSKAMRLLPEQLGTQDVVDWYPVDLAAKTVWEIANTAVHRMQETGLVQEVTHLVNPAITSYTKLAQTICEALQRRSGGDVQMSSFQNWIHRLKDVPHTLQDLESNPAAKLLDFYESLSAVGTGLPRLSTRRTSLISRTLSEMKPVDKALMIVWVNGWEI
ncbi:putative secondary metabolism biosynthetic enzyme [Elasticomyces elasticus]|nr:putative secondary metabolism biosynthetic enzyme [Elasticomyces elasticus]